MKILPKIGYVYCLWSFDFPWRYKVGYSATPDYRLADIEASMQRHYGAHLKIRRAIKVPMLFAYRFEQTIHRSFFWRPVSGMRGSGHTEWSAWLNFLAFILAWLISYTLGSRCPQYIAAVVLCIPFPLDYCIMILAFAALQIALAVGVVWLAFNHFLV